MDLANPAGSTSLVGAFVTGACDGRRDLVRWLDQFRDYHELADHVGPDREAFLTHYCYPEAEYASHYVANGSSPRGYLGPAACRYLLFDIDRAGDLNAALADARTLVRFLRSEYGPGLDDGIAAFFSGSKGFHVAIELRPAWVAAATVPAICKRLALQIAAKAGVPIDTSIYDHQHLIRLPNSKHPKTGFYKRYLTIEEFFQLGIGQIRELARHPAAYPVPRAASPVPALEDDWLAATTPTPAATSPSGCGHPVVPKFVRDFIGFGDVQDPGRAITLFRCAAALSEAFHLHGSDAVINGLLEEIALKTGLEPADVRRQISTGIEHGRRKGTPT